MKQIILAVRYFLLMIIAFGLFSAFAVCIWLCYSMPRDIATLGGVIGLAWWTYRFICFQIDRK